MAPNVAAMLSYIPICLVGLVCAILFGFVIEPHKNNPFVRFHALQSLAVHVIVLVLWIGWMIFATIASFVIPFFHILSIPVSLLVFLAGLILMVILMIKSYGNEAWKLPWVGDWAEKTANK